MILCILKVNQRYAVDRQLILQNNVLCCTQLLYLFWFRLLINDRFELPSLIHMNKQCLQQIFSLIKWGESQSE